MVEAWPSSIGATGLAAATVPCRTEEKSGAQILRGDSYTPHHPMDTADLKKGGGAVGLGVRPVELNFRRNTWTN